MSEILGEGLGSKHDWRNLGTRTHHNYQLISTLFCCRDCNMLFRHYYHVEPDIFAAMKDCNIPDICAFKKDTDG